MTCIHKNSQDECLYYHAWNNKWFECSEEICPMTRLEKVEMENDVAMNLKKHKTWVSNQWRSFLKDCPPAWWKYKKKST